MKKRDNKLQLIAKSAVALSLILYPSMLIQTPTKNSITKAKETTSTENLTVEVGNYVLKVSENNTAEIIKYINKNNEKFKNIPEKINKKYFTIQKGKKIKYIFQFYRCRQKGNNYSYGI